MTNVEDCTSVLITHLQE